jgi:hypothetical protein
MSEGTVPGGATGATPGWSAPGAAPAPERGDVGYGQPAAAYPSLPSPTHAPQGWSGVPAHKPGIIALRPLTFGDIVEASFACLRRNPRTFLGLALLTSLVVLLVMGVLGLLAWLVVSTAGSGDGLDVMLALGVTSSVALLLFISTATSIALSGILAYPVGEAVLGRTASMGETWRRTRRFLPRLLGLCVVLVIPPTVVFAALVALIVWGFASGPAAVGALGVVAVLCLALATSWLGIRLVLATPALVLEDLGVVASLRRSWRLTPGLFWRTFGILFVSGLLIGIVQYVLSFAFQLGGMLLGFAVGSMGTGQAADMVAGVVTVGASVLGSLLSGVVTQPFMAAVLALLYTDARIRKEGFDLALARAAAGATPIGR